MWLHQNCASHGASQSARLFGVGLSSAVAGLALARSLAFLFWPYRQLAQLGLENLPGRVSWHGG